MAKKDIRVIVINVGEEPKVKMIPNELHALQEVVGGYIECIPFLDKYDLVLNEEGKLNNLPPNFPIFGGKDILFGNAFITKTNHNTGNFASLTEKECEKLLRELEGLTRYTEDDDIDPEDFIKSHFFVW